MVRGFCIGNSSFTGSCVIHQQHHQEHASFSHSCCIKSSARDASFNGAAITFPSLADIRPKTELEDNSMPFLQFNSAEEVTSRYRSYHEKFVIRCYEVGSNRKASVQTIANLLQEVACNHARSVGFSTDGFATTISMRQHRLIWVTTRMHIEIQEYPQWGEEVEIETWFQFEGKIGTRRDWVITNIKTGQTIAKATSTWALMNQDTRRLSRLNEDVRNEFELYVTHPPRWAFPVNGSKKNIPKLQDWDYIKDQLMPRRGDLDMNQHVNNVTYIGWILESLPLNILNNYELSEITLEFRRECKHDDVVTSMASTTDESSSSSSSSSCNFTHLLNLSDNSHAEINRAWSLWKKSTK